MSKLPVWIVTSLSGKLGIKCPQKDCGGKAVVSRKWAQPRMYEQPDGQLVMIVGRSCTYCFQTAQVPERYKGGRPRG